jgi:hypothetical protein
MTKHLCRPQFVFKTKKVQRKNLKKDIYRSWKTYFWVKDVINPVLAQLHFPGACKSLVHQNRKSHSCRSWSRQSVFTSKAQTLIVKAEVWLLTWDFQPRWSLFQRTRAFADPKSGCTACSDFFQCWLGFGLGLGLMRICEDWDRAVPTHGYFHFVISRCSLLLPSIMILNRQHQGLLWAVPTRWAAELQGRSDNNGAYQSSCIVARSIFPGFFVSLKILVMSGPTGACTAIIHTKCFLENRGTKWKKHKQKQTKSKEGQSNYASSCVLIPYWLPKECRFWII